MFGEKESLIEEITCMHACMVPASVVEELFACRAVADKFGVAGGTGAGDERLVGDAAKNQAALNPENTIFECVSFPCALPPRAPCSLLLACNTWLASEVPRPCIYTRVSCCVLLAHGCAAVGLSIGLAGRLALGAADGYEREKDACGGGVSRGSVLFFGGGGA